MADQLRRKGDPKINTTVGTGGTRIATTPQGSGRGGDEDKSSPSNGLVLETIAEQGPQPAEEETFLTEARRTEVQQRADDVEYLKGLFGDKFAEWELSHGLDQATQWGKSYVTWFSDASANGKTPTDVDPAFLDAYNTINAEVAGGETEAPTVDPGFTHAEVMAKAEDPEFLRQIFGDRFTEWETNNGLDQAVIWAKGTVKWFADNSESGVTPEVADAMGYVDLFVLINDAITASKAADAEPIAHDFSDPETLRGMFGDDFDWMVKSQGMEAAMAWAQEKAEHWVETSEAENKWGEAEQTTMADIYDPDGNLKIQIPADGTLYIGFGPEDKDFLDLNAESQTLGQGSNSVVSLFNPTDEVIQALLADSGVENVVIGGHGSEGNIFTVDENGRSRERTGEEFAALFQGTAVENLFLNICEGAQGAEGVAAKCKEMGMEVLAWAESVQDTGAIMAATTLVAIAEGAGSGDPVTALQETADAYDGSGANLLAMTEVDTAKA